MKSKRLFPFGRRRGHHRHVRRHPLVPLGQVAPQTRRAGDRDAGGHRHRQAGGRLGHHRAAKGDRNQAPHLGHPAQAATSSPASEVERGDLLGEVQVMPDVVSLNEAELRERSSKLAVERAKRELDRAVKLGPAGRRPWASWTSCARTSSWRSRSGRRPRPGCGWCARGRPARPGGRAPPPTVESTVTGTVLTVPVKEGSSVINANSFNPGTTVAVVADMSDMIFKGRVDESEVGKLRAGMPVEIVVGALEDTKFVGTLERIAPKSQIKDGTTEFEIEAAFRPPRDVVVRAGYSANANIVLDRAAERPRHQREPAHLREGPPLRRGGGAPTRFERREVRLGLSGRRAGRGASPA